MTTKAKNEELLLLADGRDGARRYRTDYWFDRRRSEPSPHARSGFPKTEDGSIHGAGKIIMTGMCSKIACYDRVKGRYKWTLIRGDKVTGTHLYAVIAVAGEA